MKKLTLLTLLLSVFALMGAQDWTEIVIPNAVFTDTTEMGVVDNWMVETVDANPATSTKTLNGEVLVTAVSGYTGAGVAKTGMYSNFTGAIIPDEPIEYMFSGMFWPDFINFGKVDSCQFVISISSWAEGTDSTERTVIATDTAWVSVQKAWDSIACSTTLDAVALGTLAGQQLVVEFGVAPQAMKGGAVVGAAAAWCDFTSPKLASRTPETASLQTTDVTRANVFVSENALYVKGNQAQETQLRMYNIAGSLVKQHNFNSRNTNVGINDVKSGIYLVVLKNAAGVQSHKVLVQ